MFDFGYLPFGGIHYLHIEKIDTTNFQISTQQWDNQAKVWNHDVVLKGLGNDSFYYECSITIYGCMLSESNPAIAKIFYQHRGFEVMRMFRKEQLEIWDSFHPLGLKGK